MTPTQLLNELETSQLLSLAQRSTIEEYNRHKPVSLYRYIRVVLYLSITAMVGGLGVLIYENINTAGHIVLLVVLSILTLVSFLFVFRQGLPYSSTLVNHPNPYLDTVLLLSCLLFLVVEGYAHYQFQVFGTRYGLATLVPAILFLFLAYRFDHQGVLSLGLSSLASWVGLTVTPGELLVKNDFTDISVLSTALVFGAMVTILSKILAIRQIKPHFHYTYLLLAGILFLAASTAGMMTFNAWKFAFSILSGLGCWYFYVNARQGESLLFLLIGLVFGYITLTYLLFSQLSLEFGAFLGSLYFLLSAAGVVWLLLNFKKLLR